MNQLTTREVYERTYSLTRRMHSLCRQMANERIDSDDYEDMSQQVDRLKSQLQGISRYCWSRVSDNDNLLSAHWSASTHILNRYSYGFPLRNKDTSNINYQINQELPVRVRHAQPVRQAVVS